MARRPWRSFPRCRPSPSPRRDAASDHPALRIGRAPLKGNGAAKARADQTTAASVDGLMMAPAAWKRGSMAYSDNSTKWPAKFATCAINCPTVPAHRTCGADVPASADGLASAVALAVALVLQVVASLLRCATATVAPKARVVADLVTGAAPKCGVKVVIVPGKVIAPAMETADLRVIVRAI